MKIKKFSGNHRFRFIDQLERWILLAKEQDLVVKISYRKKEKKNKDKKLSGKKKAIIIIACLLVVAIIAASFGGYFYAKSLLQNTQREELDETDLGIVETEEAPQQQSSEEQAKESFFQKLTNNTLSSEDVINIALFGVDSRNMESTSGRSDATMVLTIDKVHKKVKITSIARDSYVAVEGHGKTKLTHAYSYGGHQLAVKTLNQNFNLNIKDFVSVNFSQLAHIIDFIGGVKINVTEAERKVMQGYIEELNKLGIETQPLEKTGNVLLSGGQAVAYARNRYTGTDKDRMDRQYEVLLAMADSAKKMSVTKYDNFVKMLLSECVTSLSDDQIMSMGLWALTASPEFERLSLPNNKCNASGKIIKGLWYYVYDIPNAKNILHDFIYENR